MNENLTGSLQENLLVLLCFSDTAAPYLVNVLDPGLLDNTIYKTIAIQAIEFYIKFKEPAKDHIADLLQSHLDDPKTERVYSSTLNSLFENQDSVNETYVLSQITEFINSQLLKTAIIEAAGALKSGNLENARAILNTSSKQEVLTFNPGIFFADPNQSLKFLSEELDPFPTGIQPLDDMKFGPAPGELFVILAPANKGKTSFLVHVGKTCVRSGLKVLHISLEMSEEKMSRKYIQGMFALSTSKDEARIAKFEMDEMNRFSSINFKTITIAVIDHKSDSRKIIANKLSKFKNRWRLYIKRFPTNGLTIQGLEAYLDSMERFLNYIPDLLILDYADLMQIGSSNVRIDTGIIYKELRRVAVERNLAIATASQSNRLAEDAKIITLKHLAEDYSKAATADNIVAYCQTQAESKIGLARLFIAKARDEEREQCVLISQCYRIGQFCLDAIMMNENRYWDELNVHFPSTGDTNGKENEKIKYRKRESSRK
jgi:hypothetical protein